MRRTRRRVEPFELRLRNEHSRLDIAWRKRAMEAQRQGTAVEEAQPSAFHRAKSACWKRFGAVYIVSTPHQPIYSLRAAWPLPSQPWK